MTTSELKTFLIQKISHINDVNFLRALKTILKTNTETNIIHLTPDQLDDIKASKKEIEKGNYLKNKILDKQVRQWLKER